MSFSSIPNSFLQTTVKSCKGRLVIKLNGEAYIDITNTETQVVSKNSLFAVGNNTIDLTVEKWNQDYACNVELSVISKDNQTHIHDFTISLEQAKPGPTKDGRTISINV